MKHPDLILASRALAASEITVEKITGGYRLHVEGDSRSFRSSPTPSKAGADMALRIFKEFTEWSDSSTHGIKQADEESGPETREELAMEFAEVLRKQPGEQTAEQERAGNEKAERSENRTQERSEDTDPSEKQAAAEPREQSAAQGNREPAEKELKDPEWREKEIERILKALSRMRT